MKKPKPYVDPSKHFEWPDFTVSISPKVLADAQRFSKENSLIMSQLVNSAIKVFISEAEAYVKEQERLKEENRYTSLVKNKPTKPESFRVYNVFSTEDAMKGKVHARGYDYSDRKPTTPKKTTPKKPTKPKK